MYAQQTIVQGQYSYIKKSKGKEEKAIKSLWKASYCHRGTMNEKVDQ